MTFPYPINVICFNRPRYLRDLLFSIKSQTVELPSELLHFWVDGFDGSKDENLGRLNQTKEVVDLIRSLFPDSQIETSHENLGIALNYWRAELNSFEGLGASSAFFLEEDLVLSPHYFEMIMRLDSQVAGDKDISHLSVTGDLAADLTSPLEYFQASGHSWGYLLRSWHHFERKPLLEHYINLIQRQPYYLRKGMELEILSDFYSRGVVIAGTSQDAIKDGLKTYFNRISISTLEPWATNIGVIGEHFQSESPHHNRAFAQDLKSFPLYFDPVNKRRLFLDGRIKTFGQAYQNYISSSAKKLGERDALLGERDALLGERDALLGERDALLGERDALLGERDALLGSKTLHFVKWVRKAMRLAK